MLSDSLNVVGLCRPLILVVLLVRERFVYVALVILIWKVYRVRSSDVVGSEMLAGIIVDESKLLARVKSLLGFWIHEKVPFHCVGHPIEPTCSLSKRATKGEMAGSDTFDSVGV